MREFIYEKIIISKKEFLLVANRKHSVSPVFCLKSGTLIFAKKKQLCGILKPLKQFTHVTGWEI